MKPILKLLKSFQYAWRGIAYCVRYERNMRIHLVCGAYLFLFSPFYGFSTVEYMILLVAVGAVIVAEVFNTAVEAAVNLKASAYDPVARLTKDVAAGGVLCAAVFSFVIGVLLFVRPKPLSRIWAYFCQNWYVALLFVFSLVLAGFFIFHSYKGVADLASAALSMRTENKNRTARQRFNKED